MARREVGSSDSGPTCPGCVSFPGGVLPSSPSPCGRLSLPLSTRLDTTPPPHPAGVPVARTSPPACRAFPPRRYGSSLVPSPGFPFWASRAVYHPLRRPAHRNVRGLPSACDVSLPACHGLRTPADLPILAKADSLVWPSVCVKTLGVRNKRLSKLYQHFRGHGSPCGLQDTRSTLRPSCSPCPTTPPWTQDSLRVGGYSLPDRDFHPARDAKLFLAR